jgi:cystathionine beta-lyase
LVTVALEETHAGWRWDFDALERAITPRTRLMLLCHPHNPVGRAWDIKELAALIDLANRHGLVICSDEIHCDLLLDPGLQHTPLACVEASFADRTITLMAPSKTWNLPGLGCSFAVIPDPSLRRRFRQSMAGLVPPVNTLGFTAAEAAYRDDGAWLAALIAYLRANRDRVRDWLVGAPHLKGCAPEATYLAWIDARAIDPANPLPRFEALGVGLSDGREFGLPGYLRLNFGCRRALLEEALRRLEPLR